MITLSSGLLEGSVLQRLGSRGANATLTGTTSEAGPITATISKGAAPLKGWKTRSVGRATGGKFTVKLQGIPAGGPYRLVFNCGKSEFRIDAFYVGDLWIMGGQSNMEGCGNLSHRAEPHPLVRSFSMRREWRLATDPLHLMPESPDGCHATTICTPEEGERMRKTNSKGVGAGVFFGREMFKRTGVPQGLICSAHGGTSMQQWDPARKDDLNYSMYGSMLLSVKTVGQPVCGMLWYQGESDANPADLLVYTERMQRLVAASRSDLGQPKLPWIIVQISRVYAADWLAGGQSWNAIQHQQFMLPVRIPNLETVSAVDLQLDDLIHIGAAGFPKLADRLARAADRMVHGNLKEKPSPRVRSICAIQPDVNGASIIDVNFDHLMGDLKSEGEPSGFSIVNSQGRDLSMVYKVTLLGNKARLHLSTTPNPNDSIFYGHGVTPVANITDGAGRALLCFGKGIANFSPGVLPYITTWRRTKVITRAQPLTKIGVPDVEALGGELRTYEKTVFDGFINEHESWQGKSGQVYFSAKIELPEKMKLEFLMGYDGPFRMWVDKKPVWSAPKAINPVVPDEGSKSITLAKGVHDIRIAMDTNGGQAWGFCLRLRRQDLTEKQIATSEFPKPFYKF